MYPSIKTESAALTGSLDENLGGIRNAAYGLTDEQAHTVPCRSALSIAVIVKHVTWVLESTLVRLGVREDSAPASPTAFYNSFRDEGETLADLLARFDRARPEYLAAMAAQDPDAVLPVPPQPWLGITESLEASNRLLLIHHVEEFARHAGHADIIREQLDGAKALELLFAAEGREGNPFVQPWRPAD